MGSELDVLLHFVQSTSAVHEFLGLFRAQSLCKHCQDPVATNHARDAEEDFVLQAELSLEQKMLEPLKTKLNQVSMEML